MVSIPISTGHELHLIQAWWCLAPWVVIGVAAFSLSMLKGAAKVELHAI